MQANIDGEVNLKRRTALPADRVGTVSSSFSASMHYDAPNANMYSFDGVMDVEGMGGGSISVSETNVVLRGCKLRCVMAHPNLCPTSRHQPFLPDQKLSPAPLAETPPGSSVASCTLEMTLK